MDTDGDWMWDDWEIGNGFKPNSSADEQVATDPNEEDIDGDGATHFEEEEQAATDPLDPNNFPSGTVGARAACGVGTPSTVIAVNVSFGFHSGSHSEKYKVILEPVQGDTRTRKRDRTNRKYGQTETRTFTLPKGAKYRVTLKHIGTSPKYRDEPKPDYDYTLEIDSNDTDQACALVLDDPEGMLGVHGESDEYFASGKEVLLYTAWLTSLTRATIPTNQKRTKIGVAEEVDLKLKPISLPSPTWALTGTPGTSTLGPTAGISSILKAGKRACTPTAEATVMGKTIKIPFNVIQPTGERAVKDSESSFPAGSQGVLMRLKITTLPEDVNFSKLELIEIDQGTTNISGIFGPPTFAADTQHHPETEWTPLGVSNEWFNDCGLIDVEPPSSWGYGTFDYSIEVRWRVTGVENGQGEFLANRTQLMTMHDNSGKSSVQKMNRTATRTP